MIARERLIDELVAAEHDIDGTADSYRSPRALTNNVEFRLGRALGRSESVTVARTLVADLVSYAVGCMFGRYSLDEPGLILADQGATLQDYLAKVPSPTFTPDADNVIPIVDGDWFEDDIVERFRQFLRAAFGEQHFEENLRFVTESLGVKNLRDYFVKSFYKDHVQRYKKRPIYWLFSSPKGSFNALIYMHRYTPSTVSTVLNEYLREFQAKLKASLEQAERSEQREGGRPAPQDAAGARRVRARRALPAGLPADRHRPRRRREGRTTRSSVPPSRRSRAWRRANERGRLPSVPTWSAASSTSAWCSGTTWRASTPPISTASTCRA